MLIQCTKKLLDELKVKPGDLQAPPGEVNPLFAWHANLLRLQRRKAVVLVNDSNKYVLVLYGLKAKHFKELHGHVLQAIREAFREEGIAEEITAQFIKSCAPRPGEVTYAKTGSRSMVAKLNKACETVQFFEDLLEETSIYQPACGKAVSRIMIGAGKNAYIRPNEELYKDLEAFAGGPVLRVRAAVLKVTLDLENREVWRRLVVPVNMTFAGLHEVLQVAFGWWDYHLHQFHIYGDEKVAASANDLNINHPAYHREGFKPVLNLVCDEGAFEFEFENDAPRKWEEGIRLSAYIPARMKYTYDFGDNWEHYIEVEKVLEDHDKNYPICLEGAGNAPPEDVGGRYGFEEFLEIIADKTHPEHEEMLTWGRSQGYKDFDLQMINWRLEHL